MTDTIATDNPAADSTFAGKSAPQTAERSELAPEPQTLTSVPFALGMAVVAAALLSSVATYMVLTGLTPFVPTREIVLGLLGLNLLFVLVMAGMIGWQIYHLWQARRSGIAGARLHVRLVSLFSIVATLPALIVAVFASVTLERGLDAWFSERTRSIIDNAQNVAEAYLREHSLVITADAKAMANDLNQAHSLYVQKSQNFVNIFTTQAALRSLAGAFIIDREGQNLIRAIAPDSNVNYIPIPAVDFDKADKGQPVVFHPSLENSLVRALYKLEAYDDAYLYVYRFVDPGVIDHLRETRLKRAEYDQLEGRRLNVQLTFGLTYVGITLIFLLSAIWFGLGVANHLVTPIGRLIDAARRVAEGDLDVKVPVSRREGDIGSLGRRFNVMTDKLRQQREDLMESSRKMDERRRFTEAVLAGVTPGVIGLDNEGNVRLANTSAFKLLEMKGKELIGAKLADVLPEMADLFKQARQRRRTTQDHVDITHDGNTRNFLIRITTEKAGSGKRGYVVTMDDITELVSAQRTSAWADVARRIAHEIKNPLTPIQLSAERIKRKYGKVILEDREVFDKCTETIVRQVGDIRAMVDEFSSFARMPKAVLEPEDIRETVKEISFMQKVGLPGIKLNTEIPDQPVMAAIDRRLISQALTNIIKNAGESIEGKRESDKDFKGEINVVLRACEGTVQIDVSDNGIGFPKKDRQRLVEPYMTTRSKGTGLGLAIVSKIMDEHQGQLHLTDAPHVAAGEGTGALVRLEMPGLPNGKPAESA